MTSYLPFTDNKGILPICIQSEYSHLKQFCLNFMKVYNLRIISVNISEVFYDSTSQNIMFIFAKQSPTLQKNIKLSYLKALFIQKAIIFTKKVKTCV